MILSKERKNLHVCIYVYIEEKHLPRLELMKVQGRKWMRGAREENAKKEKVKINGEIWGEGIIPHS